ncbi:hypothetical protein B5C26_07010 [Photorhabdus luminescens]|uniref:O-antigen polysaccharide polymerase Wzy n=1 Tax=Photorhabdus luminescens TaxID=29488 RepID=UPI000B4DC00E|nr:O-antigen polysaccharide polymerase Wzy [Photorhabdus luminescens]OWO83345.1 hypothetical protein B5C26_07010 [Photorhabdus luminescens]
MDKHKYHFFLILQMIISTMFFTFYVMKTLSIDIIDNCISLNMIIFVLQLLFTYTIITTFTFVRKTSLYSIFLFCYFLFLLGGIFLGGENTAKTIKTVNGTDILSNSIVFESILFHLVILSFIHLGFLFSLLIKRNNNKSLIKFKPSLFYNARVLFLFSLPFCIIKFAYEINTIATIGYVNYYKDGVNMPFFINAMRFVFEISFFLILSSRPNFKKFKKYSVIFMLVMSLFLITGVRSKFILYFIFLFWYYYSFFQKKDISILSMLISFPLIISVLILSQLHRQNWVFNSDLNYLEYFFSSQSISFYILPLTVKYIDCFTSFMPAILSPFSFYSLIYNTQSLDRLNNVQLLGDIISYAQLGDYYLDGNGIGGSFIAELYQAGILISIIFSFSLGFLINYFDIKVYKNRLYLAISFFIVSNIAYMPRSSFFKGPYMLLLYLFVFLLFTQLPKIKFIKTK